jgi:outer membrane protein assembly factor BamB
MKSFPKRNLIICGILLISVAFLVADEITSNWRGPNRDGKYLESNLLESWPEDGPELVFSITGLGMGYASAAVTENMIYTTGLVEEIGYVFAFDKLGKLVWKQDYGNEWNRAYPGTRTTPIVVGDLLYIEGTNGAVVCLNAKDGTIVWQTNLIDEYGARQIRYGITESLLIDGDRVICTPGGIEDNVIALNRFNGEKIWSSSGGGGRSAYCSPVLIEHGGKRIIVTMTDKFIIGVNADNGAALWKYKYHSNLEINPNTPYYQDGRIYCVSGYGTGGIQLILSPNGEEIKEIWRNQTMDSQMDAFIVHEGYIYGTSQTRPGWHSLNWKSGEETFTGPGLGKGNVIFAEGLIYQYSDNGKVGLIRPNPEKFDLISSFEITAGTYEHWAHPVIADGILYIRHGDTLLAYNIRR